MKFFLYLFLSLTSVSCKSQINILSNEIANIEPSCKIKNNYLYEVFEILFKEDSIITWKNRSKKLLIVSALKSEKDILIRIIPKVREEYSLPKLPNTYSAYLMYKDIFVSYWGDDKLFFQSKKSKFIDTLFKINERKLENDILPKIDGDDFYGYEFVIRNNEVIFLGEGFFPTPLLMDNN